MTQSLPLVVQCFAWLPFFFDIEFAVFDDDMLDPMTSLPFQFPNPQQYGYSNGRAIVGIAVSALTASTYGDVPRVPLVPLWPACVPLCRSPWHTALSFLQSSHNVVHLVGLGDYGDLSGHEHALSSGSLGNLSYCARS